MDIPTTLLELVKIYSPSGCEANATKYLQERMLELGFYHAEKDEVGNIIGTIGNGPKKIMLLGHIDTVTGEIPVRIENGIIFGRGTVDAKGPLCSFVDAASEIINIPDWQIVVVGAVDEERDSIGARHIIDKYSPDFVIVGEPSHWDRITLGYKGSSWIETKIIQPRTHTASNTKNASALLIETWINIQEWINNYNFDKEKIFDQLQCTISNLASGEEAFEEWALMLVGVRLPLDLSPSDWFSILKSICPSADLLQKGFPMSAYRSDKNNKLVRAFLRAIRSQEGKPRFIYKTGTADMNIVGANWDCPILAYGPGDSNLDHTPEEQIHIEEYNKSVFVITKVLKTLTQSE